MVLFAGDELLAPDILPRLVAREWLLREDSNSRVASDWLNQGLPEYLAWRYLLDARPEVARPVVESATRDSTARNGLDKHTGGVYSGLANAGIAPSFYEQRGLLVFRTLETVIDRERVDRVLAGVVRRSERDSLSLSDFERLCEDVAGRDLNWFFRYFFDQRSVPEIELRRLPSESPGVVAGEIIVRGLPPEGSVRVEMAVRTAQGTVEHSVATRGEVTPFTVNVPAAATEIILDPDQRILRWTEAARKSKAQSQILAALPKRITRTNVGEAITLYRRALEADAEDASLRAQSLRERLGELEWAHDEWPAALEDLEAAINGHSVAPFETYFTRGKAYLYHGVVSLHEKRPQDALEDARAGLALPQVVLFQIVEREPVEARGVTTLSRSLETLQDAASHY